MSKIVIDPVTRIEGHLRLEAEVSDGKVVNAWSSSTLFRGIEKILRNRDPRDAWFWTQRFCGVCTSAHSIASIRAVENALDIKIPPNAELIRNLIIAVQNWHDHVVHFYHLHALDWVDIVSALKADPVKAASFAGSLSDWPNNSAPYYRKVQERLKAFVNTGRLGPFANAYWGHPAYRLSPEANLMAAVHYLEALELQKEVVKIHAILGSKNPHLQTFLVGGMAIPVDPDAQNAINADRLITMKGLLQKALDFTEKVYIPDVLAIGSCYPEWTKIGGGVGNFICYGEYPDADGKRWYPSGVIVGRQLDKVLPVDQEKVAERVDHSWYDYPGAAGKGLHPWQGETTPHYTGPLPPYEYLNTEGKYSWIKAPRYDELPMETGPLGRLLVAYAAGHKETREVVNGALGALKIAPADLVSTLGRTAARALDALLCTRQAMVWLDQLVDNMAKGEYRIHNGERWEPSSWPKEARGYGWHEAPRGALGHWIRIKDQKIENYQAVVPSTWNASPRDAAGKLGPYEASLVNTPLHDPKRPLELLRTVHSFDPCIGCAVHLVDGKGGELVTVTVTP